MTAKDCVGLAETAIWNTARLAVNYAESQIGKLGGFKKMGKCVFENNIEEAKGMKCCSSRFFFLKDGSVRGGTFTLNFLNDYARFNKHGEQITNPFTYMALEVLERVLWELSAKEVNLDTSIQIHLSVVHGKHNCWVEADVNISKIVDNKVGVIGTVACEKAGRLECC